MFQSSVIFGILTGSKLLGIEILKKIQVKQIQDKVSLAMRKCQTEGRKVTVGNVLNPGEFDNIVRLNEGFRVLRKLRGSPAYWENAKKVDTR